MTQNKALTLQTHVANRASEFGKSLPGHISAEKFVRTAQTAIAMTRGIENADPKSLLIACSKAAADGLILDGREAAIVVDYKGEVQYRPMMRGLLKLAYNTGEIKSISVQVVNEADEFEYVLGDDERIHHKINFGMARGKAVAVYAIAKLKDGGVIREVMTVEQINGIRDRSDAYKAFVNKKIKSTPWSTDWEEMARKTVFRRVSKWLPSSTDRDMERVHEAAERIDDDYNFAAEPAPEPVKRQTAAEKLKAAASVKEEPAEVVEEAEIIEHDPDTGEVTDSHSSEDRSDSMQAEDVF